MSIKGLYNGLVFLLIAIIAFYLGTLLYRPLERTMDTIVEVPNKITPVEVSDPVPNFIDDRNTNTTGFPLGANYPGRFCPEKLPTNQRVSGCMVGCSPCSPLCSGEGNPCNITAPVPSPAWQPQSASTVQYRLRTGNYVPAYCPQGPVKLQIAPGCSGLGDVRDDSSPKDVKCYTAKNLLCNELLSNN
jgi:hypothetical protein